MIYLDFSISFLMLKIILGVTSSIALNGIAIHVNSIKTQVVSVTYTKNAIQLFIQQGRL